MTVITNIEPDLYWCQNWVTDQVNYMPIDLALESLQCGFLPKTQVVLFEEKAVHPLKHANAHAHSVENAS